MLFRSQVRSLIFQACFRALVCWRRNGRGKPSLVRCYQVLTSFQGWIFWGSWRPCCPRKGLWRGRDRLRWCRRSCRILRQGIMDSVGTVSWSFIALFIWPFHCFALNIYHWISILWIQKYFLLVFLVYSNISVMLSRLVPLRWGLRWCLYLSASPPH